MTTKPGSEFKLERYKFILQEIHFQNENVYKGLNLFQALATALVGAGVGLFSTWRSLGISPDAARTGIRSLVASLILIAIFVVISILSGVFSWFDYRKEEVELLGEVVGPKFRRAPELRNFWRWHETYLILFIVAVVIAIYLFVENQIIPLIR